jgi:ribosomal protein L12E/L44/L45/RPP1/RPP2
MNKFKQIVWLASYPKSGNTWLRLLFDAYFLVECDINAIFTSVSDDTAYRHITGTGSDPRHFPIDVQQLTRPMALLRLVEEYNRSKVDGVPLLIKTHSGNYLANGIQLLPEAVSKRAIYLVRDPRSVAVSFAKHMGVSIDEIIETMQKRHFALTANAEGSNKMDDTIGHYRFHVESFSGKNGELIGARVFRYEDLRRIPEKVFAQMLGHIGVEIDQERVKRAVELTQLSRLRKQESEKGFVEASAKSKSPFFGDGKVAGWKSELTQAQARQIMKLAGRSAQNFYN